MGRIVINETTAGRFGLSPTGAIGTVITGIGALGSQVVGVVAEVPALARSGRPPARAPAAYG